MTKTFSVFPNRIDAAMVGFKSSDIEPLASAIRCNPVTGYVKVGSTSVSVPAHAAAEISAYLVRSGWAAA